MKLSFSEWMAAVDKACQVKAGMSVHDLPDCCFRDWYDDGVKPASAASKAIKSAMSE